MLIDSGKLVSLGLFFATKNEQEQLVRGLAQPGMLLDKPARSVALIEVTPSGDLKTVASFGDWGPEMDTIYSESLLARSIRTKQALSDKSEGTSTTVLPLSTDYPVGALVLQHQSQAPEWSKDSLETFAIIGAMYLKKQAKPASSEAPDLTPRQFEVLSLMAQGLTNQEIALRTATSVSNITQTCSALFRKLGVTDRQKAIANAKQLGLIQLAA